MTTERTRFFTRDTGFYRSFFALAGMLILQNIIVLSVNLADNLMIGGYSEVSLSGVASVNQVQFVLQQVLGGIGDGMVVLASQYWGQNRVEPVRRLSSIAVWFGLLFSAALFAAVSIFPEGTLRIFTTDDAVVAEGVRYLRVVRFTYPVFALTTILLAMLRSTETVKIAVIVSVSTLILNCGINYTLISGHFGAPALGVVGAGIGTLVARCVELVIVICYLAFRDQKLHVRLSTFFRIDRTLLRDYLKICLPIVITAALWGVNTALQTVILGHMDTAAIAANSVSSTFYLTVKVAAVGASSAAAILIGKAIGAGKMAQIREYTRTLQVMFLGVGVIISSLLFFLRGPLLSIYNLSGETKALANSFILVLVVTGFGMAYEMPTLYGIVRGGGDSRFVMANDLISIWAIVLPLSFIMAFVVKASPVVVVMCLNADQVFKCIPGFLRVNHYKWVKKLTRA